MIIQPVDLGTLTLNHVFRQVCTLGSHPFWLDSGDSGVLQGESLWAMGAAPRKVFNSTDTPEKDPFTLLTELRNTLPSWKGGTGLQAIPLGIFGFSYEAGASAIPIPVPSEDPTGIPSFFGAAYSAVLVGGHGKSGAYICADSADACAAMERALEGSAPAGRTPFFSVRGSLWPDRDLEDYVEGVERVLAYIEAGDIYQANIARRFEGSVLPGSDPVVLFERLRETSSAPFGAYVDLGTKQVLSASPECLLRWDGNGDVSSFPIKGTAGREGSPEEDKEAARRLLADPKENAEHIMIVDLVRNDLGRVAEYGTVSVPEPMAVQSFPNVHHLVSRVSGRLAEGRTEEDLWKAVFPGGSITGAPKIRACEIIAEIEQAQRGIYCGAIGFLDPRGGGCANIPIRTGVVAGDRVFFHVGGGIVSDSSPEREAAETEVKARGWRRALAEKEPL